ncbi:hypothetical protein T265_15153, partial [Opisthorchis viverrini]
MIDYSDISGQPHGSAPTRPSSKLRALVSNCCTQRYRLRNGNMLESFRYEAATAGM